MAERKDGAGMLVDDCAAISKRLSEKFDASEDLTGKYDLEVSSPGIDRPLVRLKDYEAYLGHVAKVELTEAEGGKKRFQGKIIAVKGENIEFTVDKDSLVVAFTAIEKAKLVLTDELLKAAMRGKVSH
jgi:ribosome maturation factor RimP